jgi:1-acyl-sn-glycerol-3-phosphate acyltransferase
MSLFDRMAYHAMRVGAWALTAGRVEIAVTGLRHIPTAGPALLVARHYHHLFDGAALLLSVPRPIHTDFTIGRVPAGQSDCKLARRFIWSALSLGNCW